MLIQDILKSSRKKHKYTQEEVANKLFVSTQAVSKWENGQSVPTIDNLLILSDLYNISLDELVQGSPFFKKPYVVGRQRNFKKSLFYFIIWLIPSALFTSYGYLSIWLFLLLLCIGIFILFPTIFNDYWVIRNDGISVTRYSPHNWKKLSEIAKKPKDTLFLNYHEITSIEIVYQSKSRLSPMDISPDSFFLNVTYGEQLYRLNLDHSTKSFLPQFTNFLTRHQVKVIDPDQIITLLITDQSLYEHFNPQTKIEI